jgi:hypothetical protein
MNQQQGHNNGNVDVEGGLGSAPFMWTHHRYFTTLN